MFVTLSAWFAKTRLPFLFTSSWPASRSMMIRSGKSKATWFLEYFPFRSWSKPLPFVLTGTGCLLCWRCFALERRCRLRLSTTLKRRSRCTYLVLPWCSLFTVCTITEDVKKTGIHLASSSGLHQNGVENNVAKQTTKSIQAAHDGFLKNYIFGATWNREGIIEYLFLRN